MNRYATKQALICMRFTKLQFLFWFAVALLTSQLGLAHDFKVGDLTIDHPYATSTVPAQSTGAVYFRTLRNRGSAPDKLLSAQSSVANRVGLHRMQMEGEVMRMREVPYLSLIHI